ncbi:hypothetical protein GLYMA_16G159550v4 [Glycine max]|nr:hypothetical protein GLYMA_16G159550v4 [Glycine max]KAH1151641.1 hypothetical protein GYH30_045242 [Glycine max]
MSSSSISYGWKYDVFLSFRGSDTRHGFTGHLYKALLDRGIYTFIDNEELQRGEEITPSLVKAIEDSRIAILVFSKNYASSTFCLDELVHILACVKEKGTMVLPVFYEVDPSDVRHQRGSYEEALNKHKEKFNDDEEKLQKWRIALRQAANLSGYHFKHGNENEYDFVGKIIKEVSQRISRTHLHVANNLVGLESRVLHVTSLLDDKYDGVLMVGIYEARTLQPFAVSGVRHASVSVSDTDTTPVLRSIFWTLQVSTCPYPCRVRCPCRCQCFIGRDPWNWRGRKNNDCSRSL